MNRWAVDGWMDGRCRSDTAVNHLSICLRHDGGMYIPYVYTLICHLPYT